MTDKSSFRETFRRSLATALPKKRGKALAKDLLRKGFLILIGCVIYALAISLLLDPNLLAPGGVSGSASIIAINIPLMIWGAVKLGFGTMLSTIFTTLVSSFFVNLLAAFPPITTTPLLAAVFGGAAMGLSMAIIFKAESTTGGTDIIVRIIRQKLPQFKTGKLFLMTDACIVAASGLVFGNIDTALYAGLACILFSLIFDYALYGGDSAKLLYIISDKHARIVERLLHELSVGVTYLDGEGAYTHHDKKVLLCAMKNQFYPKTRQVVLEEDPDAFLIVGQASEIFGEGFKSHDQPML